MYIAGYHNIIVSYPLSIGNHNDSVDKSLKWWINVRNPSRIMDNFIMKD